ncbi:M64 family metallopeptidase [Andreprevotia chitinilytica]|uniref:M64 family metallopeptidase n=1 Tax=Andreprevotia chitinilytica TaxID=396808 RepID=UPI0009FDCC71|nr:M64 family metallopeptidase [Andreprevotia chitinilytica]
MPVNAAIGHEANRDDRVVTAGLGELLRINVLYLGDGYLAGQKDRFMQDVARFNAAIMIEPLSGYTRYFNAYAAFVPSSESGASKEDGSTLRDTAFLCSYYTNDVDRMLTCNSRRVMTMKKQLLPNADFIVMIVNSAQFGGAGGAMVVANRTSSDIVLHEFAHTFANLADEYGGTEAYGEEQPSAYEAGTLQCYEAVNVTRQTERAQIPWAHWLDADVPLPTQPETASASTIGLFEGANYLAKGVYRPTLNSLMRDESQPLGPVNTEAFVLAIYDRVSPIDKVAPAPNSTVIWQGPGTLSVHGHHRHVDVAGGPRLFQASRPGQGKRAEAEPANDAAFDRRLPRRSWQ